MPVHIVSHDDVLRAASGKPIAIYNQHSTRVRTRATQPQPRWERWNKIMGFDCEFQMEHNEATGQNVNKPGRVSVTNYYGQVFYDVFVYFPKKRGFRCWRNHRSKGFGCYKEDVELDHGARPIAEVAQNLHNIFQDAIMVGHATDNDIKIFDSWVFDGLSYRDTQAANAYRGYANPRSVHGPKLSTLTLNVLGRQIQEGEHSSVEDAQATMELYRLNEESIENEQWRLISFKMGTPREIQAKHQNHLDECMAEEKLWYSLQTDAEPVVPAIVLLPKPIPDLMMDAHDSSDGPAATGDMSTSSASCTSPAPTATLTQAVLDESLISAMHTTTTPIKPTTVGKTTQLSAKEKAAIQIALPRPVLTCANRPAKYVSVTESVVISEPIMSHAVDKTYAAAASAYYLRSDC